MSRRVIRLQAKKNMQNRLILLMLFISVVLPAKPADKPLEQVLHYKVLVEEEEKGRLEARIYTSAEGCFKISLVTRLEVFFLDIVSDIRLEYENGQLKTARSMKHINGVRTEYTEMISRNNRVMVSGSDVDDLTLSNPVTFSVGRLYHHEPSGESSILSERHGREVSIQTIGFHTYELKQPDGTRNYFFYNKGICKEMQTRMRGRKVRFVLL